MHAARIDALRTRLDQLQLDALLVTHSPNVRYLVGLRASAAALLISARRVAIVVDSRYVTAAGHLASRLPDASVTRATRSLDDAVAGILQSDPPGRVGIEAAHLPVARFNKLSSLLTTASSSSRHELVTTERLIERARAVKDEGEIATLRTAGRMLSAVAGEVVALVTPGRTELQVAASIDSALRSAGFEAIAFETIVASGPNSALPHARPTGRTIGACEGVVLDFGGIYDGYCVDLTRTVHVGPATGAFRRLFDAVAEAHAAALAAVKPGVLAVDIDGAARRALDRHGLGDAFGHGTGHGLGLEVHEEPRISPQAPADEPVVAGMVFTIEPGAYVPGVGGVRIEDDVLVVEDGCEILT